MASLTVRDLDEEVKQRLRIRAASHGRSMEAEVRSILADAVADSPAQYGLASRIRARFAPLGYVELDIPPRTDLPRAATFDE